MKITVLSQIADGTLYQLSEPTTFKSNCVSYDDSEVDQNNISDVVESCTDIQYDHVISAILAGKDAYYPCDNTGKKLSDRPLIHTQTNPSPITVFIHLYGPDTKLYHHLSTPDDSSCEFDDWHPDHKI